MNPTLSLLFRVACLTAISAPALALSVTNLDTVPHTVRYVAAGTVHEATADAGETIRFLGLPDGRLSLKTAHPAPSTGSLHADGLLSGIVGVARNQDIPANRQDDYTIWPGGTLQRQSSRTSQQRF